MAYSTTGLQNTQTVTAVNRVTTYRYDRYGRADSTTLPGGAVLTVSIDSLNRTRTSRGPNGVHVTYAYDSLSHVRSITDAEGQTYQYSYNPLGWLITQINADTNHTLSARTDSFFYSAAGLVTKHRDRNANATSTTYDSLGRVLTLTLADGRVTKYGYDPNGLFQADSNAASIDTVRTDPTGLIHTDFTKQAGRSYTITSTSDDNGLLRSTVLRAGTTTWDSLSYNYDFDLRLSEISTTTGGAANTFFHYAADGLLRSWKLPTTNHDSVLVNYSQTHQPISLSYSRAALDTLDELVARDTLDRVVQQAIGPLGSMNDTVRFFAYDSSGRLTTYADSLSADSLICVPDPHGQDGEHCTPSGGWTFIAKSNYTYDSANNRTDLGAVIRPGNRDSVFNGYTLTYDNAGNLTHKSKTGFDQFYYWNSIGQLDSVVTNGAKVAFLYDGQGRRVAKITGGDLRYIYSGSQLIAEVDSSITNATYIYRYYPGIDNPHSVKEVSGTYYYLSAIGTPGVVAVIDSTGKIRNRYRYNPWGGLEDSVETVSNVLKFAGREYDSETHLYYNRARYYDPQLARFISEDPVGQSAGTNQYGYASNNPVGASDPSGEVACDSGNPYDADGWWGDCSPEEDGHGSYLSGGPTTVAYSCTWDANLNLSCDTPDPMLAAYANVLMGLGVTCANGGPCPLVTDQAASSCNNLGTDCSLMLSAISELSATPGCTDLGAAASDLWSRSNFFMAPNNDDFQAITYFPRVIWGLPYVAFTPRTFGAPGTTYLDLAHEMAHVARGTDDDHDPETRSRHNPAQAVALDCQGAYSQVYGQLRGAEGDNGFPLP